MKRWNVSKIHTKLNNLEKAVEIMRVRAIDSLLTLEHDMTILEATKLVDDTIQTVLNYEKPPEKSRTWWRS
jgi:hypothetical protein